MGFMRGESRARDAYDDWCTAMGGTDADGRVLPRWDRLTGQEQAAWQQLTESVGTAAVRAAQRMDSPTAGMYGPPVSAIPPAGVMGHPSGGFLPASAVPSMQP